MPRVHTQIRGLHLHNGCSRSQPSLGRDVGQEQHAVGDGGGRGQEHTHNSRSGQNLTDGNHIRFSILPMYRQPADACKELLVLCYLRPLGQ